jgi:hypothetical protein
MYEITLITASRGKYGIKAGQVNINHKLFVDQALATIGMNYSEVLWKNGADSYKIIIEALWNNNYRVLIADIAGNNLKTLKKSTFVAFGPLNY